MSGNNSGYSGVPENGKSSGHVGNGSSDDNKIGVMSPSCSKASNPPAKQETTFTEVPEGDGHGEFVSISHYQTICQKDIDHVMKEFASKQYSSCAPGDGTILNNCMSIFGRDYTCEFVDNINGTLCDSYPERLVIPVRKIEMDERTEFNEIEYISKIRDSTACRVRSRFVCPVILFDNKFICRSGTLSNGKVAAYNIATKPEPPRTRHVQGGITGRIGRAASDILYTCVHRVGCVVEALCSMADMNMIENFRNTDNDVLKICRINWICDLMVEDRKCVKFINVSSSEKVYLQIYKEFRIEKMPYPGCEFFRTYHERGHNAEGLVFDWNKDKVTVKLELSENCRSTFPNIYKVYKEMDIIALTQTYMKILLSSLVKDAGSMLLHCISGWDRTPLFIAMLRLSLWADGVIHESLGWMEMVYLTLAYDWYLFGHDLPSRLTAREEILYFCYSFLPHIASDDFSVTRMFEELTPEQKAGRKFPEYKPGRRNELKRISKNVVSVYHQYVTPKLRSEFDITITDIYAQLTPIHYNFTAARF